MPATIGILGESTVTTVDVETTVYTVPADRAAKVRVLFAVQGPAGGGVNYEIKVGMPGEEKTISRVMAANDDVLSGMTGAGSIVSNTVGLVDAAGAIGDLDGVGSDFLLLPYPHDFYLSAGDTVRFTPNTTAPDDHLLQVIGVEDDV